MNSSRYGNKLFDALIYENKIDGQYMRGVDQTATRSAWIQRVTTISQNRKSEISNIGKSTE